MRRRLPILLTLLAACTSVNPAFDEQDTTGEQATSTAGSEEGDADVGDGDGDTGDGDGDTGDGDGDTGDGDGDGDGDPAELCEPDEILEPYAPLMANEVTNISAVNAPQFDAYPAECYAMKICAAAQTNCNVSSNALGRYYSGGPFSPGTNALAPTPIKIAFYGGPASCGMPLILGPLQSFELEYSNGDGATKTVSLRVPCLNGDGDVPPLWVGEDGSTFWDADLTEAAALW